LGFFTAGGMNDAPAYVTAGGASVSYHSSIGTPLLQGSSTAAVRFTAGGGLEYAVTPAISVKAEYLYIDRPGDFLYAPGECAHPGCFSRTGAINEARFGANVHFGGYEPLK
jgi:opacity protein-like surface antigen